MKILTALFITLQVYSFYGVIRVHQAPILQIPDELSRVLQYKRLGTKVYLNKNTLTDSKYYETFSRDGTKGYIEKRFVKIIFNDVRELEKNISFKGEDPTNYILSEPVPDNYPFESPNNKKADINFNYHFAHKSSYEYGRDKVRESTNPILAFELGLKRRPLFDLEDRFYYGIIFSVQTMVNEYGFDDRFFSEESHALLGIGSTFSYSFYKEEKFSIESNLKLLANYQRTFVEIEDLNNATKEELDFSGINFMGMTSLTFTHKNLFGNKDFSLIHGPGITFRLPYEMTSETSLELYSMLDQQNYSSSFQAEFSYSVGFSYQY